MIWHIVRFDTSGLDAGTSEVFATSLESLASIDEVAWLRVARDVGDPDVLGLITAFEDHDALEAYRVHPQHLPILERIRELSIPKVVLDVATDDDVHELP